MRDFDKNIRVTSVGLRPPSVTLIFYFNLKRDYLNKIIINIFIFHCAMVTYNFDLTFILLGYLFFDLTRYNGVAFYPSVPQLFCGFRPKLQSAAADGLKNYCLKLLKI